jgi:NADH-quinone oxidoreductase subunit C
MDKVQNPLIESLVKEEFGDAIRGIEESYNMLDIMVKRERIIDVLKWLKEHPLLQFNFLTTLCGMHFPENKNEELAIVYHMHSFSNNVRIRLHTFFPIDDPKIKSATTVFEAANWMERETYDFFGIQFEGHPNLKRILNMDDLGYFPMLRQYPLEDGTRTDKDDRYFGR